MDDTFVIRVAMPSTMAASRLVLQDRLHGWGCDNVDNMVLVFSELVTNATLHTAADSQTVITHQRPFVRIEVHDSSHTVPEMRNATAAQPGGFGLRIVSELSSSWGWLQTATGKAVWSIIACDR